MTELELRLQVQEKELKNQLHKLQEAQTLLDKTQAELAEKDKTLTKSRDDLARMTVQFEKSVDKVISLSYQKPSSDRGFLTRVAQKDGDWCFIICQSHRSTNRRVSALPGSNNPGCTFHTAA